MTLRPTPFIRPFAAILLAVVVMVQGYLLHHEIEHALEGEESCVICQLGAYQDDALLDSQSATNAVGNSAALLVATYTFHTLHQSHFTPRSPPIRAV